MIRSRLEKIREQLRELLARLKPNPSQPKNQSNKSCLAEDMSGLSAQEKELQKW